MQKRVLGEMEQSMTNAALPDSALTPDDIRTVSPALASYTQNSIGEDPLETSRPVAARLQLA
ncbi:MAG TPA: hypothetical protein VJV22_16285 [Acidobacteriaceae bacterium]|nr:hypothetical protein [Acidobacteriaceae bacterium]